ncbi:MAG: PIG-L deacetylase family protein, partial [Terriglobia bacterium]
MAELEAIHAGGRDQLLKWREAMIIELIPPVKPPAGPHLVVIEPHMDDAALSMGGRLLHRRGQCRITILSVVKWTNFTTYLLLGRNVLSVRDVTDLRQKESALAARLLGVEYRCLDWTDAPLRFWPAEPWSPAMAERFKATPQAFVNLAPNPQDVRSLAGTLAENLKALAPDELWIPMGLGDHIDHRTTRSACLMVLAEARQQFEGLPVSLYEEVPYAGASGHASQIAAALARCGSHLVRATEDITDAFEEKLRLVSVYASQFKPSYIDAVIRRFAESEGGRAGKFAEAYHRLEGTPRLPLESSLARNWAGLETLRKDVCALLPERMHCRR